MLSSGGLHHAAQGYASGFCVFNDPALAIHYLLRGGAAGGLQGRASPLFPYIGNKCIWTLSGRLSRIDKGFRARRAGTQMGIESYHSDPLTHTQIPANLRPDTHRHAGETVAAVKERYSPPTSLAGRTSPIDGE